MCHAFIPSFESLCVYGQAAVNQVGALLKGMIIRGNPRMYLSYLLSRKFLEALAKTGKVVIPREHKRWDVSYLIQCGSMLSGNPRIPLRHLMLPHAMTVLKGQSSVTRISSFEGRSTIRIAHDDDFLTMSCESREPDCS